MEWSLCEAQHGNWRERGAVRRLVMVKRGESAGLSMPCLVRMKTKASHRDVHAGE